MHIAVYEKSPKFRACWFPWRLANVIDSCSLFDAAHAMTGSTNYQTTYCNSFPTCCNIFFLFWTLGLTIYLKIHQNSSAWLPTSNTVRGLGYLVQW